MWPVTVANPGFFFRRLESGLVLDLIDGHAGRLGIDQLGVEAVAVEVDDVVGLPPPVGAVSVGTQLMTLSLVPTVTWLRMF